MTTESKTDPREHVQDASGQFEHRKISKILVVINKDYGRKAVDECLRLVQFGLEHPEVHLLYVVDMEPVPALDNGLEKKWYDGLREEASEVIDEEVKRLQDEGIEPEVLAPHFGIAAEAILRAEKMVQPDLIIMSARGLSTLKKFLTGSISDSVSKEAKAPVLIAK